MIHIFAMFVCLVGILSPSTTLLSTVFDIVLAWQFIVNLSYLDQNFIEGYYD